MSDGVFACPKLMRDLLIHQAVDSTPQSFLFTRRQTGMRNFGSEYDAGGGIRVIRREFLRLLGRCANDPSCDPVARLTIPSGMNTSADKIVIKLPGVKVPFAELHP